MVWSLLAAIAVARYPGPNGLDRWGFSMLKPSLHSTFLLRVSDLGSLAALAAGSLLAALVVVGRDRRRAAVCLVGPLMAAVLVELVLKPVVGRRYIGVLCFPSGTVTVVAALAAVWVLAVPYWLRWATVVLSTIVVGLMMVAVIGLRWHYPSDALAGVAFGVGVILCLDGALHLIRRS